MRIEVARLPREGRTWALDAVHPWMREVGEGAVGGEVVEATWRLRVAPTGRRSALVEGQGSLVARVPCARCGEPVEVEVPIDQRLPFRARSELPEGREVELSEEDLDVGYFDGEGLELLDVVSEVLALAAPDRVTCARSVCEHALQPAMPQDDDSGSTSPFAKLKGRF